MKAKDFDKKFEEGQEDIVGDLEFKKALFGIWLSDKPAQKDLKEKMLGQN